MTTTQKNEIVLTFENEELAEYVRLTARRKNFDLETYIVDNFEWDEVPPCLSAWNEDKKLKQICKDCDLRDCPDRKAKEE